MSLFADFEKATLDFPRNIGPQLLAEFLSHNSFKDQDRLNISLSSLSSRLGTCGYFRPELPSKRYPHIVIDPSKTARLGYGGRSWSWPTYKIDRTLPGVLCHEFGHFVDHVLGYPSNNKEFQKDVIKNYEKVSGYEPNASERFAESMRLFISNPNLLEKACPWRFGFLTDLGLVPRTNKCFEEVLHDAHAPDRQINQAISWARRKK